MDIKLTQSLLSQYLSTTATPSQIAKHLSLCGPTIERMHKENNDWVYEIEIITNRVDTASAFGIAREATAILPQFGHPAKLISPQDKDLLELHSNIQKTKPEPIKNQLTVKITDSVLIPRFTCIILDSAQVKESPAKTQKILSLSGQRPLNNIIDTTNELTLRLGQPCHAFDLDKIDKQTLIVRTSKRGEKITTLDNKTHTLTGDDIVIEDGNGNLIDLCGIMGGNASKIDQSTKRVLLFVQTYDPKRIRKTSLSLQIRTLAAQIFEKSPDPELVLPTLATGVNLLQKRAQTQIASTILDIYPHPIPNKTITLDLNWLDKFSGITIPHKQSQKILNSLGIKNTISKHNLKCSIPSWRHKDISIKEDLAEEILRIYGYYKLPSILPATIPPKTNTDPLLNYEQKTKIFLSHIGFTEIFNYSLISQKLFNKANLPIMPSIEIRNPLSPDFQYMRRSLIPGILQDLADNQGKTKPPLQIFELANIYLPSHHNPNTLPQEKSILCIGLQGKDYLHSKGYLETLLDYLHIKNTSYLPLKKSKLFDINSSTHVYANKNYLGLIGQINSQVKNNFKLPMQTQIFIINLDFEVISKLASSIHQFSPAPIYPAIINDITLQSNKPIGNLIQLIKQKNPLITQIIYKYSHQNKHTFTLYFNHPTKNLTQKEVSQIKDSLLELV